MALKQSRSFAEDLSYKKNLVYCIMYMYLVIVVCMFNIND